MFIGPIRQKAVQYGYFPYWPDSSQFNNSYIKSLLAQFSLNQLIDTPIHFTEHPSSLIDLFMTNNVNYVTHCGVGPSLQDLTRYHCPIIGF